MPVRFLLAAALLAAAGCGGDIKVAPVSGTVTMDGKPLPKAYVNFQPKGSPDNPYPGTGSYAVTDENGRYTLKMVEGAKPGAVVGTHRVEIALPSVEDAGKHADTGTPDGGSGPARGGKVKQVPEQYNERSTLTFVVPPGGTDKADFPLTSKP